MRKKGKVLTLTALGFLLIWPLQGNASPQGQQGSVRLDRSGSVPVFRVTVVDRTTPAINYRDRSGSTKVDFQGTPLMPDARGVATVESKQGRMQINAKMDHLTPATRFGPEYLTYVLWAITPEGQPKNLGEVLLNGDDNKIDVTTDLQTFGLIVTAEPYFAVTQPSDVVVMENVVRPDTKGTINPIDAKYELLKRGHYVLNANPAELRPLPINSYTPLEVFEAQNAVRIARWTGADHYAADAFQKAETSLQNAEDQRTAGGSGQKTAVQYARDASQEAEDARLITIKRMEDEDAANTKAAAAQAESQRAAAESAKSEAEIAAARAAEEKNNAEAARAEAEAQRENAQVERDRAKLAASAAQQEASAAQQQASAAQQAASASEQEKSELREQLRQQLNVILETRETARGLIVNLSDVLFDTAQYTLKPGAREKLAKISGIILTHPSLTLSVEGHTDSVGSDEYNLQLSEQRANAVRAYLVSQGVKPDAITATGFGKSNPVATNDTASGRQQNRRVELVVSGPEISQK